MAEHIAIRATASSGSANAWRTHANRYGLRIESATLARVCKAFRGFVFGRFAVAPVEIAGFW
jgi:hypothetical protein